MLLHLNKLGQHGAHAERGGSASINTGEQRVGETIDDLGSEVALDHLRNGFILAHRTGWMEQVRRAF